MIMFYVAGATGVVASLAASGDGAVMVDGVGELFVVH